MSSVGVDTALAGAVAFLILVLFGSVAVAVFVRRASSSSQARTLLLWMRKHWPGMLEGEKFNRELGKVISNSLMDSLWIWFIRMCVIIVALAAAVSLWWILGARLSYW